MYTAQSGFKEGLSQMLDVFRRELRGGVVWMGTAKEEEAAREIVRNVHAAYPGVYFTFDHSH